MLEYIRSNGSSKYHQYNNLKVVIAFSKDISSIRYGQKKGTNYSFSNTKINLLEYSKIINSNVVDNNHNH